MLIKYSVRKFINDENWYLRLNRARHLEPHARFVKPACIHSRQVDVVQGTPNTSDDPQLALYVGIISFILRNMLTYTSQAPYVSKLIHLTS